MALRNALIIAVWLAFIVWSWRAGSRARDEAMARQRRIGWGYGYGQGYVDGERGEYAPGAPPDGRTRDKADPTTLETTTGRPT